MRRFASGFETIRQVLGYLGRRRRFVWLSLGCALVSVATTLAVPVMTGRAIDRIVEAGHVDFGAVAQVLLAIGVTMLVTAATQWIMNVVNNRIAYRTVRDIRAEAFAKIERLPLGYIDTHPSGEIVSRVIADVDQFAEGLLMGFTQLFTGVMTIVGTLAIMLVQNATIALVVLLITPLSLIVAAFIARRTYAMFALQAESRARQTAFIDEAIAGQKVVRAFGRERQMADAFDDIAQELEVRSRKAIFFSSITNPATRFVNALVYAGVAIVGAFSVMSGGLTVGALSAFLSYANQYTKPFNEISGVMAELQNALSCAARVFALIGEQEDAPDAPGAIELRDAQGRVGFSDVSFSYVKGQRLIEHVNLDVRPGQRIAIVGPTGSGKTTLINLLMRFYDVTGGAISVDGFDIRHLTRRSLRRGFGMVLQETWLRSGTVRENIALGKPDATEAEIIDAARRAHAHSFIMRLPDGYDTVLGEDEDALSQGQKQLMCIARVMLCLPPILILDEATSSIDTRTEQRIQAAFASMMQGRTSFIVAHRLSTIQSADVILVMKDGQVIEQGSHETLLRADGFYAQLYKSQFAK